MHACTMKVWPHAGGGQCQWYYPAADAFVDQRCDDFAFEGVSIVVPPSRGLILSQICQVSNIAVLYE